VIPGPDPAVQTSLIRQADTHGKIKCNRCKRKLRGGDAGDAVRDKGKAGYVCKVGCAR
jgi:hypothetical protein